jgi:hypothetical protein
MKSTQNNPKLFYFKIEYLKKKLLSPISTFLNASNKSKSFSKSFAIFLWLYFYFLQVME